MSKHDILTAEDVAGYKLSGAVEAGVRRAREQTGAAFGVVRVLDYGCGRGRSVAKLRALGSEAYGVDVDPEPLANGRPYFVTYGLDGNAILMQIGANGRTLFPDGFFCFIFSEQVFEHVRDIDAVAVELKRLTPPGGVGHHVFSAPYRLVEEHLRMPCIHWLPKNGLRRALIRLCVGTNRVPVWRELEGRPAREIAETYHRYSCEKTYYRSWRAVHKAFERHGLTVSFDVPQRPDVPGLHGVLLRFCRLLGWRFYREAYLATVVLQMETRNAI